MKTFLTVMGVILFLLAGLSVYGAVRSLNGKKSFNTRYNRAREDMSPERQKRGDRLIAIGMLIVAVGAVIFGLDVMGINVPRYLGEIVILIGLIFDVAASGGR